MKVTLYLSSFVLLGGVLSSCYSNRMLVDDDVYVMKNSELPVGESLTDETNYSTYKYKQDRGVTANSYYYDPYNIAAMNACDCNPFYFTPFDCGWGTRNYGYSGLNDLYYGYGYYNAFGRYLFGPGYMNYGANQYGYYGNMFSPYYNPYGGFYFSTSYSSPFYYNNAIFYNTNPFGYNPYSYGNSNNFGYSNEYGNSNVVYNSHSGPRGSLSGYSNSGNRSNGYVIKSHSSVASNNGTHTIVVKPLTNRVHAGQQPNNSVRTESRYVVGNSRLDNASSYKPTQGRPSYNSTESRNGTTSTRPTGVPVNSRNTTIEQRGTSQPVNRGTSGGSVGGGTRSGGANHSTPGTRRN